MLSPESAAQSVPVVSCPQEAIQELPDDPLEIDFAMPTVPEDGADGALATTPLTIANMADVRAAVAADGEISATRRRDVLSGLTRLEIISTTSLAAIATDATSVRTALGSCNPARANITNKKEAPEHTVLRGVGVEALCSPPPRSAKPHQHLAPAWDELLSKVAIPYQRHALARFARFCSQSGIAADQVNVMTLRIFFYAQVAEELLKSPKNILKGTISNWNRASREVDGWPQVKLSSPLRPVPFMFPLDRFPATFQADIAKWEARVSAKPQGSSIFSESALLKPLRADTIRSQIFPFRQVATALVKSGAKQLEEITELASLCDPAAVQVALEYEYERLKQNERRVLEMANKLRLLGRHLNLPSAQQREMERLFSRRHKHPLQITEKNRQRLTQFDDLDTLRRLAMAPRRAATKARSLRNPLRAAKSMERSVAVSLLLQIAPRLATLRQLEVAWFCFQPDGTALVHIPPKAMKSGRAIELIVGRETTALLSEFIATFRPSLPFAHGPYLFPGEKGGPRSKNAMFEAIVAAAAEAGVTMNPHLFRHLLQKVCVEWDPTSVNDVSRVLGHGSLTTTLAFYSDRNGKAASRRIDAILSRNDGQPLETDR